jgi:hypothetical protein
MVIPRFRLPRSESVLRAGCGLLLQFPQPLLDSDANVTA